MPQLKKMTAGNTNLLRIFYKELPTILTTITFTEIVDAAATCTNYNISFNHLAYEKEDSSSTCISGKYCRLNASHIILALSNC